MISDDIAGISDWLLGHAAKGDSIGPKTTLLLAENLLDLSGQVRRMEAVPMKLDAPELRLGFHKLRAAHDAE